MKASNKHLPLVIFFEPLGEHGGLVPFDSAYCQSLAEHELDVVWVTSDETQINSIACELWTPFQNIFGDSPSWKRGLNYARGLWTVLKRVISERKKRRLVIHQQFITVLPLDIIFIILLRIIGVPRVIAPHDTLPFNISRMLEGLLPTFYRQYDIIIAHSQREIAYFQEVKNDPTAVRYIPLGNQNQEYEDAASMSTFEARVKLGLPASAPLILFLGRMRKEKGLEYLIAALPEVLNELPDTILLVAGHPGREDFNCYENRIDKIGVRDSVRTRWEYISKDELASFYVASNVVAVPYTQAYQSGVILTAYAFRRPVVASAVGGLVEQVQDGKTGLLIPSKDSRVLAKALLRILNNPDLANDMGKAGHQWAAHTGNWETIAKKTVKIYRELWHKNAKNRRKNKSWKSCCS